MRDAELGNEGLRLLGAGLPRRTATTTQWIALKHARRADLPH